MPLIVLSSLLLVVIDTCLQYEVFQANVRALDYLQGSRMRVAVSVMTCMAVHVAHISMFGTLYWFFSRLTHVSGFMPSGKPCVLMIYSSPPRPSPASGMESEYPLA
jgi:nitrate reductase gamma subunit